MSNGNNVKNIKLTNYQYLFYILEEPSAMCLKT